MKHTLFDNFDAETTMGLNMDAYREWCEDNDIEPTQDGFYDWQRDELETIWDDVREGIKNYDSDNRGHFIIDGTLGMWDGTKSIVPVTKDNLYDAIIKCINDMDYIVMENDDENGIVEITAIHHDGRNCFTIVKVTDECRERYDEWLHSEYLTSDNKTFEIDEKDLISINLEEYI